MFLRYNCRQREREHDFDRLSHIDNTSVNYCNLPNSFLLLNMTFFVFLFLCSFCLLSLFCILSKKDNHNSKINEREQT